MSNAKSLTGGRRRDVDMTEGSIVRHLITFALPLLAGNIFQQLYNMVDTWVVGNFVSNEAFSAVGSVGPIINMLIGAFMGLSSGAGAVISQYYGAKQFDRVKKAYRQAFILDLGLAAFAFLLFQIAPRQIISIFGDGSEAYFSFAIKYFRIYLFFTFANFMQPLTSTFFSAIGKPKLGMFLSLTRQIIFLLPLLLVLPRFFGIDGLVYAGPIADFFAALTAILLFTKEFRRSEYRNK